ncbi:MAG TPA: metal ABC transporter ATP-binding protein [Candidatus Thermoplasmatota archaeon]|nr:metal ABC transporter ATP-binding protein [Candidatus Thermoplasmatota archaeon]
MAVKPPTIEARGVTVEYGRERALEDASLTIAAGEFVGVVGPNGAGKSTLLRALLGLAPIRRGESKLFGSPVHDFTDWSRIAFVPQNASQVDAQFPATALEIALLGRVPKRGLFRPLTAGDRAKALGAMREVGVEKLAGRLVGTLSGGERQRVLLAKALASDPDLLIMDEPTTGVDPGARAEFYELLDHLNHDHEITIVLVSHDAEAIAETAHRVVVVNRRIVFDGTPAAFREEGALSGAYGFDIRHARTGVHPGGEA